MARVAHHFEKLYPDPHQNQKPEAVEDYNGAMEAKNGAVEAYNKVVEGLFSIAAQIRITLMRSRIRIEVMRIRIRIKVKSRIPISIKAMRIRYTAYY
jgi:hypothetical protein